MSKVTIADKVTNLYKRAHVENAEVSRKEIIAMIVTEFKLDNDPKGKMKASNYYTTAKKKATSVKAVKAVKAVKIVYPSDYAIMHKGHNIDNIQATSDSQARRIAKAKFGPKVTVSKY